MSFSVNSSLQFIVKEISIVTKSGDIIDITPLYQEINIFDSMFSPVITGSVLIQDSVGLSDKLLFDGSEAILIEITKSDESDIANFKRGFRIYKQAGRENQNLNNETYALYFVSDELFYSDQQRINQSFQSTYSNVIEKILINYLSVAENNLGGLYETSYGIRDIRIPNLRPLEAIDWCTKRAVDINMAPCFMFFQNNIGFNFATLTTLLQQSEILDIKFEPKNTKDSNRLSEMSAARALEVVAQTDILEKTRSGVNASQFIGFDPTTRTIAKKNISFGDVDSLIKKANENPNFTSIKNRAGVDSQMAFTSKQTVSVFNSAHSLSNYVKQNDAPSLSKNEQYEIYIAQRKSLLTNLMSKRIKLVMPGNFQLSSGFNVNVMAPSFSIKEKGDDNEDTGLSGKYIIVATRHIIKYDKHETIIEVASNSTSNEFIPSSSASETTEMIEF